ncbi:MAG TPA: SDR family oxidoreductase [Phycisphaerae bacterium]|nr:SDR family oxidoreductase [Phycisphaerae bacterium]HPS52714.1 SDR family oxidoreductase [Phycisphaerae bacterium]
MIDINLDGKVAIVTGASRGIGRAIAGSLAAAGAQVVLAARSAELIEEVAVDIESAGGRATPFVTDIADEQSVEALFEMVADDFGRLDVLVNNAGVGIYGPMDEFDLEDLDTILAVNVRGTFACCREALKIMKPQNNGYIINIASVCGEKGYANQSAYSASKHAIMGLTKSLAAETLEFGIRVTAILPGGVDTEMVAQSRPDLDRSILIKPQDIAYTVMFLLGLNDSCAIDQINIRRRNAKPF